MKLRLRSLQSKETVKIEVPNSCTLQQLKQTLSQALFSSPSSSLSSLCFSLNRKDGLHESSPQESLHSLGITSGDLIYFSMNPNDFSSSVHGSISDGTVQEHGGVSSGQGNYREPSLNQSVNVQSFESLGYDMDKNPGTLKGQSSVNVGDINFEEPRSKESGVGQESSFNSFNREHSGKNLSSNLETPIQDGKFEKYESVETDMSDAVTEELGSPTGEIVETHELASEEGMDIDYVPDQLVAKQLSEPYFLKRVLREELGDDVSDRKLLVIAIHAVFLDSGFVGFDSVSGLRVDHFHLPEEWPSEALTLSLSYNLPELIGNEVVTESVVLKFRSLGNFVNVYGALSSGASELHQLCLDEKRFAPIINLVWGNCEKKDSMNETDGQNLENEVFGFWKIVKDGLALPLLIDLCDKTGLDLPPCLMRLPTELKLRILESLSGVDIARLGCVCSEMRYLSSNNDLWRQKLAEEFPSTVSVGTTNWKRRYALSWECKTNRRKRRQLSNRPSGPRLRRPTYFIVRRDPNSLVFPSPIIGGDYDLLPGLGIPYPLGQPGHAIPRIQRQSSNFSPNCNLGGFNS